MSRISLGIGNYYGKVTAYEDDGKHYIEIDNYDEPSRREISKDFYDAIVKEFDS